MVRAGFSSWRACLCWGLATLAVSQSFALVMPAALAHPIPGANIDNPVLAFEFARSPADLDAIFGTVGDPQRAVRITGMNRGNLLDYLFMLVYGSFLFAFFAATATETGDRRWLRIGWLGPIAGCADGIENGLLLSIGTAMTNPWPELGFLPFPVWTKFVLLAAASAANAFAFIRMRAWPLAVACVPAPLAIWWGAAEPMRYGQSAASTIALCWAAMLGWAIWRVVRPLRATT